MAVPQLDASEIHAYDVFPEADLSDPAARRQTAPVAIKGFRQVMELWGVSDAQAAHILDIDRTRLARLGGPEEPDPGPEVLARIAHVLAIFQALNALYDQPLADSWVGLRNRDPLFEGKAPLVRLMEGGLEGLREVLAFVEARRSGA